MSKLMLEECFRGLMPSVISYCGCGSPNNAVRTVLNDNPDTPGFRTYTTTCEFCEAEKEFVYEKQDDGRWCMIDN